MFKYIPTRKAVYSFHNMIREQKMKVSSVVLTHLTNHWSFNPLSANPTKWPNTLKQFVGKLPTNCLSVFDHFVKLALKGLSNDQLVMTAITKLAKRKFSLSIH